MLWRDQNIPDVTDVLLGLGAVILIILVTGPVLLVVEAIKVTPPFASCLALRT